MLKLLPAAALLAASMAMVAHAAEPPGPAPAPVVLDTQELDAVTAGAPRGISVPLSVKQPARPKRPVSPTPPAIIGILISL